MVIEQRLEEVLAEREQMAAAIRALDDHITPEQRKFSELYKQFLPIIDKCRKETK